MVTLHCNCEDWKYAKKIDSIIMYANVHGIKYDGKQFIYCPWCNKKLEVSK